jgi:hypothetical protein
MVGIDIDYIPSILLGNKRYTHYPIRRIERQQAEQAVSYPNLQNKIILRISPNSLQANLNAYYVATYYVSENRTPVNFIITHQQHQQHNGNLMTMLPSNLENYELLIVPQSHSFSDTVVTEL